MEVAIVHIEWPSYGGAEYVALTLASRLARGGIGSVLVTGTRYEPELARRLFGFDHEPARWEPIPAKLEPRAPAAWLPRMARLKYALKLSGYRRLLRYLRREYPCAVLVETQLNMPWAVDVQYIHFPAVAEDTVLDNLGGGVIYKIYDAIADRLVRRAVGRLGAPRIALTNSRYSQRWILNVYGLRARVVHPPVDTSWVPRTDGSERAAITLSRFVRGKGLHRLLESRLDSVGYHLYIVGGAHSEKEKRYLKEVEALASRAGWASVHPNLPRGSLAELLARARYYIHPPYPEHFGIAVAQAMAAGLVPIVYCEGGAWEELVEPSDSGDCYEHPVEIPSIIKGIDARWEEHSRKARRYIEEQGDITPQAFVDNVARVIGEAAENVC